MGERARVDALWQAGVPVVALFLLVFAVIAHPSPALSTAFAAPASPEAGATGVASCAGSTCHGREEPTGAVVRLDELKIWQDESSPAGAHSRAWRVLGEPRARAIAARLGIGDPQSAAVCTGCHVGAGAARPSEGVGCEGCHGNAANWLASHYAVGGSHANNVARGMRALDQPAVRAAICLDCHYGSDKSGQFAEHRIMAAGHPRLSFELDLFSTLEKHWNEDADYAQRKRAPSAATLWVVGQAMALDRALGLFANDRLANRGMFPELYFFDCQSCHRRISDEPSYRPSSPTNPGRDTPIGTVPFQDENMIMLAAAARVGAPDLASRFVADSIAFHKAITVSRPAALAAAARLRSDARALADRLSGIGTREVFAMIAALSDTVTAPRFTDYEGSVQAVMAVDTLLSSLSDAGAVSRADVARIRPSIDRAYAATHDPNAYNPLAFRTALRTATNAIGGLR
ncbi:multiheme c-type cytochrome [Sphingomonas sp.]|uniref:multiheme c-type cytochrome n=1 Tax=Sphingomonas sp. TaxID=28214 RepID=UPI0025EF120E|nr:multiheme c-type cytochrome [Sphingomonas sp.]